MHIPFGRRGRRRLQASFRRGDLLHLLEAGIQAIQLSPYHADLPARHPVRLGTAAGFLACYFPPVTLSSRGKPSDPEIISSHPCSLSERYNTAPRGAESAGAIEYPSEVAELDPGVVPGGLMPVITRAVEWLEGDDHLLSAGVPGEGGGVEPPLTEQTRRSVIIIGAEGRSVPGSGPGWGSGLGGFGGAGASVGDGPAILAGDGHAPR